MKSLEDLGLIYLEHRDSSGSEAGYPYVPLDGRKPWESSVEGARPIGPPVNYPVVNDRPISREDEDSRADGYTQGKSLIFKNNVGIAPVQFYQIPDERFKKMARRGIGFLRTPLTALSLPTRTLFTLESAKIERVRDLVELSEEELMNLRRMGKVSVDAVKDRLGRINFNLRN